MFDNFLNSDNDADIVFKDVITLILLGIIVIFIILLFHVNPVGKDEEEKVKQPGRMSIEAYWDNDKDIDIDLWVKHQNHASVGYPRRDGEIMNLVRDDLGYANDPAKINFENVFVRTLEPGEYIINLHMYNNKGNVFPLKAGVHVRIELGNIQDTAIYRSKKLDKVITFNAPNEEITVMRFIIDKYGNFVEGSLHDNPQQIRGFTAPNVQRNIYPSP